VVAYTEGIMGRSKALLWDPVAGTPSFVGGDEPDGVYASALTADGLVLENARDRTGETIPCVSRAGKPWTRLDS
jgi:hypothetical protein